MTSKEQVYGLCIVCDMQPHEQSKRCCVDWQPLEIYAQRDALKRELHSARVALGIHAYVASEEWLSGYRLIIGFDTLEQLQTAHQSIVDLGKALANEESEKHG